MTGWIAYTIVVTALLAAFAWALERVLFVWRLPTRGVWIAAMVASAAAPFAASTWASNHARGRIVLGARGSRA